MFELTHSFVQSPDDAGSGHGTKVLATLVKPWANTDRVVMADSYFASLQAAKRVMSMGLRFIGVVKTATHGYPMIYLSNVQLDAGKGDRKGLLHTDPETGTKYLAFVWLTVTEGALLLLVLRLLLQMLSSARDGGNETRVQMLLQRKWTLSLINLKLLHLLQRCQHDRSPQPHQVGVDVGEEGAHDELGQVLQPDYLWHVGSRCLFAPQRLPWQQAQSWRPKEVLRAAHCRPDRQLVCVTEPILLDCFLNLILL